MEIQQVRYFLAVAETLNFTRAAERCGVSQPSLTRAIQLLEAELGGRLFHRERLHTHMTELGRMMRPFLVAVSENIDAARAEAAAYRRLESAPLTIGAMCTVGPAIIAEFILDFRMAYPNIELAITDCSAKSLIDMMIAGELDVGLYGSPAPLDQRLHALNLFSERFVIAMSPSHHLAQREVIKAADLHGQAYVNRANCEYLDVVRAEFRKIGVQTRRVFSSERDDWVQGMVKAGLGFGFIPEFSITDPGLIARPLIDPAFSRRIDLVTVRGRPHAPSIGAFVSEARKFAWPDRRSACKQDSWATG